MIDKEVVIVGSGPAGLSAALEASKSGAHVLLVDENSKPGGQLFKQIHKFFGSKDHRARNPWSRYWYGLVKGSRKSSYRSLA